MDVNGWSQSPVLARKLAMQLMARVQQQPAAAMRCYVVGPAQPQQLVDELDAAVPVWAVATYHPDRLPPPGAEQWAVAGGEAGKSLLLTLSLETRGVLQLQAWALQADGSVVERRIAIDD